MISNSAHGDGPGLEAIALSLRAKRSRVSECNRRDTPVMAEAADFHWGRVIVVVFIGVFWG